MRGGAAKFECGFGGDWLDVCHAPDAVSSEEFSLMFAHEWVAVWVVALPVRGIFENRGVAEGVGLLR